MDEMRGCGAKWERVPPHGRYELVRCAASILLGEPAPPGAAKSAFIVCPDCLFGPPDGGPGEPAEEPEERAAA
jgi:hypothetical protein